MGIEILSAQPPDFLKLLAHELRWKLVLALTQSDYRVQELVNLLHEPQNLVSYHLKQLRDLHLVAERRSTADARDVYYNLDLVQLQSGYESVAMALHPALVSGKRAGDEPQTLKRVLFLCTENSARSQMAEGILRHLSGGNLIQVFSAGTQPSSVHPYAVSVLAKMGIDISQQQAKPVDKFHGQSFNAIITVCDRARENCPTFPGDYQRIHWSLPDPVMVVGDDAQYLAFEHIAEQLTIRVRFFLTQLNDKKVENQ